MTKSSGTILAGALTLGLAACTAFGPTRNPPQMPSPEHYSVATQAKQLPAADGVAQSVAEGARRAVSLRNHTGHFTPMVFCLMYLHFG